MIGRSVLNADGVLTRDEFNQVLSDRREMHAEKRQSRKDEMRARFDTDGDGEISEAERQSAKESLRTFRDRRGEDRPRGPRMDKRSKSGDNRWEEIDVNGDGLVSAQEHRAGADKMFEMLDADGDGVLTEGEGRRRKPKRRF